MERPGSHRALGLAKKQVDPACSLMRRKHVKAYQKQPRGPQGSQVGAPATISDASACGCGRWCCPRTGWSGSIASRSDSTPASLSCCRCGGEQAVCLHVPPRKQALCVTRPMGRNYYALHSLGFPGMPQWAHQNMLWLTRLTSQGTHMASRMNLLAVLAAASVGAVCGYGARSWGWTEAHAQTPAPTTPGNFVVAGADTAFLVVDSSARTATLCSYKGQPPQNSMHCIKQALP